MIYCYEDAIATDFLRSINGVTKWSGSLLQRRELEGCSHNLADNSFGFIIFSM